MFKSIGKKLKELATVTCYMGIGGSFIAFLVMLIIGCVEDIALLIGLSFAVLVVGCPLSWIGSFTLYGYGELIERTSRIDDNLSLLKEKIIRKEKTPTTITVKKIINEEKDDNIECKHNLESKDEKVIINEGAESIDASLFENCASIKEVILPNTLKNISDESFSGFLSLTSIKIPTNVTNIGNHAFKDCKSLVSITISNSVTRIGYYAFENCKSLNKIVIPKGVIRILDGMFSNCTSLTSITLSDNVTSIGSSALYKCSSLTSIVIPSSVTNIASNAFYGCESLTIYCESQSKPDGWSNNWNPDNCPVVWGYKE